MCVEILSRFIENRFQFNNAHDPHISTEISTNTKFPHNIRPRSPALQRKRGKLEVKKGKEKGVALYTTELLIYTQQQQQQPDQLVLILRARSQYHDYLHHFRANT